MKAVVTAVLIFTCPLEIIWAGCKSDCRDEYESEVESCRLLYDDPDDSDDLRFCIENAKDEFESCIEECDN